MRLKTARRLFPQPKKIAKGQQAIQRHSPNTAKPRKRKTSGRQTIPGDTRRELPYFGYGYIKDPGDLVPHVGMTFYSFRIMVILGGYFILLFYHCDHLE